MFATRLPRSRTAIALLLAAIALLPSAGCGYCFFGFTCGPGNCCDNFRCRENCLERVREIESETAGVSTESDCPLNALADFIGGLLPPQQ